MLKCVNVSHVKSNTFSSDKLVKKHSKKQTKKLSSPKKDFKLNQQLLNDIMGVLINKQQGKSTCTLDPSLYSSLSSADFFASIFAYVKCCVLTYVKEFNFSGPSSVAIDNKIEQALDLVKSHLMFAVREEVEVLKEQIKELVERNDRLEVENKILKDEASPETLQKLQVELQQQTNEQKSKQANNEQQTKQQPKSQE